MLSRGKLCVQMVRGNFDVTVISEQATKEMQYKEPEPNEKIDNSDEKGVDSDCASEINSNKSNANKNQIEEVKQSEYQSSDKCSDSDSASGNESNDANKNQIEEVKQSEYQSSDKCSDSDSASGNESNDTNENQSKETEKDESETSDLQSLPDFSDSGDSFDPAGESISSSSEEEVERSAKPTQKKRKNKAEPYLWKQNVRKRKRIYGKEYVSRKGKICPEKTPKFNDCSKCRFKCDENFNEDLRKKICMDYYKLGSDDKQKAFISSCIRNISVQRRKRTITGKPRSVSREFSFVKNNETVRCCLKFLCTTLCVSKAVITRVAQYKNEHGFYQGHDKRIGISPINKTPEDQVLLVKQHINTFPRVESHYCRKDSTKMYLSPDLNVKLMHRLYSTVFCVEKKVKPVSYYVYYNIFESYEPKLSFFKPKKDQCPQCNAYARSLEKDLLKEQYEAHKKRENESLQMKAEDKQKSVENKGITYRSITFDMQAILTLPFAGDNQIYYKRKLNAYNFTIYENYTTDGYCYIWDECNGMKGSNEVATCILKYLSQLPATVEHVSAFSDTCGGQNRNKYICAAMLHAVASIENIKTIDLKYMETGHSYLEADSIHANIERTRKHKNIYTTREYALLISTARIKPQYKVEVLNFSDFLDFKSLGNLCLENTKIDNTNENIQWLKIKWLRFEKSKPGIIQFKYELTKDHFREFNVRRNHTRKKSRLFTDIKDYKLEKVNKSLIPISEAKKNDLMFLLEKNIIPKDYSNFYGELPTSSNELLQNNFSDNEVD